MNRWIWKLSRETVLLLSLALLAAAPAVSQQESRWGKDYFPNVPLKTHTGEEVRFFDDVIKDKVVAINFIYTSCPDSCPLETARLKEVQNILGDRVGKDVFFYSISIDPEVDTVPVLKAYAEKFRIGPGWKFLTGKREDVELIGKKLGMYIAAIKDSSNNHSLSLIIGNQKSGKWMKRSPFENPYYLATQIGSWLHNWKMPEPGQDTYANAPKLRKLSNGETLFRTRCSLCHSIGAGDVENTEGDLGPDLLNVVQNRDRKWLSRWLAEPDKMLAEKDPLAVSLYVKYNEVPMPNLRLTSVDVEALIEFMDEESKRIAGTKKIEKVVGPANKDKEDDPHKNHH